MRAVVLEGPYSVAIGVVPDARVEPTDVPRADHLCPDLRQTAAQAGRVLGHVTLAKQMGALPIDFSKGDPVQQILEARRRNAPRARGAENVPGVMCGIEAVADRALDWLDATAENPAIVIETLIHLASPTGRIGSAGLYVPHDPGGMNPHANRGEFRISFGKLWGSAPGRLRSRATRPNCATVSPMGDEHRGGDLRTVLVTEDDEDLRELVVMTLESAGYQVETARNGLEALQRVSLHMPDLILLDMRMPVMNGWEFAAEYLRRYENRALRAPIVVVTAAEHVAKRAQEIHADGYLAKPFSLDELSAKVGLHLAAA